MQSLNPCLIPEEPRTVLEILTSNGYEAFLVGGSVRDLIMGNIPKDWDISTNATPDIIQSLFQNAITTGIQHGTVTVIVNKQRIEVTTYRTDGVYLNHRRPNSVTFSSSWIDDVCRRDFTINAVMFHPHTGLIDPMHGINDIYAKKICAVGEANVRFQEDALRMLRAIRFSAQLGFAIVDTTMQAIQQHAALIQKVSAERIRDELTKLLISANPLRFVLLEEANILAHILPEFQSALNVPQNHPHHIYSVGMHSLHSLSHINAVPHLRWTMLLHDLGKIVTKTTDSSGVDHFYRHSIQSLQISQTIMNRFRFDNNTSSKILTLIRYHDRPISPSPLSIKKVLHEIGDDLFLDLLSVKRADAKAQSPQFLQQKLCMIDQIEIAYQKIKKNNECYSLKDLALQGQDLIALGYKPGKQLGKVLQTLLKKVMQHPTHNTKERLIEILQKIKE